MKLRKSFIFGFIFVGYLGQYTTSHAQQVNSLPAGRENPSDVKTAIQKAVNLVSPPNAKATIGSTRSAIMMKACSQPLSVTLSGVMPYEEASVKCSEPSPWTLYINVNLEVDTGIVVVKTPIEQGQTISASDLTVQMQPISNYAGRQIFTDPTQLDGDIASVGMNAGQIVASYDVRKPIIVQAGQLTPVNVIGDGMDISVEATADQDGHLGDTILMTNTSSNRRFTAQVTENGPVVYLNKAD